VSSDNVDDSKIVKDVNILLEITSIVEDTLVDFSTPIIDEVFVSSDSTSDDVDEIVEFNILAEPSKLFEFSCADYEFMVVPTEFSSNESSEFLAVIQQMISGVSFFTGCLKFMPKSSIPPLKGLDVCPLRHHVYIIFSFLGFILRVSTALHLPVTYDDNLTKQIAICNDNYKFAAYAYNILQKFAVDNKVIVLSHSIVRKLHV